MRIPVSIDLEDLAENFVEECTHQQTMEFLLAVDKACGDAGFTENLIIALATSLAGDLEPHDRKDVAQAISKALGVTT